MKFSKKNSREAFTPPKAKPLSTIGYSIDFIFYPTILVDYIYNVDESDYGSNPKISLKTAEDDGEAFFLALRRLKMLISE